MIVYINGVATLRCDGCFTQLDARPMPGEEEGNFGGIPGGKGWSERIIDNLIRHFHINDECEPKFRANAPKRPTPPPFKVMP